MYSLFINSMTVSLTFVAVTAAPNGGGCYDSDGNQGTDTFPCDSEAETSFCCVAGYICLSNGLCQPASNRSDYLTPYFTVIVPTIHGILLQCALRFAIKTKPGKLNFAVHLFASLWRGH
ncbi:hypothetical protein BDR22DRAFT_638439 [Usnea florida]